MTPSSQRPLGWLRLPPPYAMFALLICLYGFVHLLRWPIYVMDTDLWYHLNSGRYLFEHGRPPHDSFFSFVTPPRQWIDYFWLFQALVYTLYSWSGYYGLIVFRALAYLAAMLLMLRFLLKGHDPDASLLTWPALLFYFLCPFLLPRFFLVRPHYFTYGFALAFLYVLELKPKQIRYLPLLALCWSNLHGIAYPVLLLIVGAYGLERIIRQVLDRSSRADLWAFLRPLALCAVAVLLTPHGWRLLPIPFTSTARASEYISELRPVTLSDLVSFHIPALTPSLHTLFNVLLSAILLSVVTAIATRRLRISHALMCLGGCYLLTKGNRFMIECLILSLPLLKANPPIPSGQLVAHLPQPVYLMLSTAVMSLSMNFLANTFGNRPAYPFSQRGLPQGVAVFLRGRPYGGTLLNHPTPGGYLQWMLYPKYKIYMDMEVPYLFTDQDIYTSSNVYGNRTMLARFLDRYHPTFISVPRAARAFPDLIKEVGGYSLVFTDDVEALYVSRQADPGLAEHHALKALDPFELMRDGPRQVLGLGPKQPGKQDEDKPVDRVQIIREARKLLKEYPDCAVTNQLAALVLNDEGGYDRALPHAERIIRNFPESPIGYLLKGDSLKGLKQFDRAIAAYKTGLDKSEGEPHEETFKDLGLTYLGAGTYQKAYQYLSKGVPLFAADSDYKDLYSLGKAARLSGRTKEARVILSYLKEKIPEDDRDTAEQVRRQLTELGVKD